MNQATRKPKPILWIGVLIFSGLVGCSRPADSSTPTLSVTQAYQTVQAKLTRAVAQTPSVTPTLLATAGGIPTDTPLPSPSPTNTIEPEPTATPKPCDLAAAGNPIDITIPDDSKMEPGEQFTKKWNLINSGTCGWTREYAAVWFSGEMMGAPSQVQIMGNVNPGASVEISVDMIAPTKPGTYQSNWKMINAAGRLFGIGPNGDSPFWVRIMVVDVPTKTPTTAAQPTETLTATPTPEVKASAAVTLSPDDRIDLDELQVDPDDDEDMLYHTNESGNHLLAPLGGATLGVFGGSQPSLGACQTTNLSTASLPVESIPLQTYLCYKTNQGLYGRIRLAAFSLTDLTLSLELLTWSQP